MSILGSLIRRLSTRRGLTYDLTVNHTLLDLINEGNLRALEDELQRTNFASMHPSHRPIHLLAALDTGNLGVLTLLLQYGWTADDRDYHGVVCVTRAVVKQDVRAMVSLLGIGANPNIPDEYGNSPLTWAAAFLDFSAYNRLVEAGGLPGARELALLGDLDGLAALGKTVAIREADSMGYTLLHLAAASGHDHVVRYLLGAEADPNAVAGKQNETPIELAALAAPYVSRFNDHLELDYPEIRRRVQDMRARFTPDAYYNVCASLLEHPGCTCGEALYKAISRDHVEVLPVLSSCTRSADGYTPLESAIIYQSIGCVKYLIESGADLNAGHNEFMFGFVGRPVHLATSKVRGELAKYGGKIRGWGTVGLPLDAYAKRVKEYRSYQLASDQPDSNKSGLDILRLLLDAGADPNNNNVLMNTLDFGHVEAAELLIHFGARINTASAILLNSMSDFYESLYRGDDINIMTIYGNTALMLATEVGNVEAMNALISRIAKRNRECTDYSPLSNAICNNDIRAIEILLEAGTDCGSFWNLRSESILCAKKYGDPNIVKLLRRYQWRNFWDSVKRR